MNKRRKNCPLVLIEWVDASQPLPAWHHLCDPPDFSAVHCASVGWLLHDGDSVKVLAPNMGDFDSESNIQASGIIKIPAAAVTSVKRVVEWRKKRKRGKR